MSSEVPRSELFLKACRREPVPQVPVWMMRQAGRYLPQYRQVRQKVSFLELCRSPELAAEVTLQPVDLMDVDAAILFSDILTPAPPMGLQLDFQPGPVIANPVRTAADIEALKIPDMEQDVPFVMETIRRLRQSLAGRVPLIGFAGAPFTLACYMVEGKGSKDFATLKRLMYAEPEQYAALMTKVTEMVRRYLNAQIAAGAQAVQVFDTWGGLLSPSDFAEYVLPYSKQLIQGVQRQDQPLIYFVKGGGTMLPLVKEAGADVLGLDWQTPLGWAREQLGDDVAVQGNLDPTVLFAPREKIRAEVKRILQENAGRLGFIFNLGHGILPSVDPDKVRYFVDTVHELGGADDA